MSPARSAARRRLRVKRFFVSAAPHLGQFVLLKGQMGKKKKNPKKEKEARKAEKAARKAAKKAQEAEKARKKAAREARGKEGAGRGGGLRVLSEERTAAREASGVAVHPSGILLVVDDEAGIFTHARGKGPVEVPIAEICGCEGVALDEGGNDALRGVGGLAQGDCVRDPREGLVDHAR